MRCNLGKSNTPYPRHTCSDVGSCWWGKDFGHLRVAVQLLNFLCLELFPAMFLQSFLEATANTTKVDLLISPVTWINTSEPWFPCLGNGENNPHLFHRVWDAGKDWRQEETGTTEDEMVGWHHQLDGHEFEQAPGVGDGQGSLECCSPWVREESDTTERLNWLRLQSQGILKIRKGSKVMWTVRHHCLFCPLSDHRQS